MKSFNSHWERVRVAINPTNLKIGLFVLSIAAIVSVIVDFVLVIAGGLLVTGGATTVDSTAAANASPTAGILALIGFLFIGLYGLLSIIAWIGGLSKTAQTGAWGWFVAVLLLTPLTTLLYGIIGPDQPQPAQ